MEENNAMTTAVTETEPADSAEAPATPDAETSGYDGDAIVPEGWKPEENPAPEPDSGGASREDEALLSLFGLKKPEAPESAETQSGAEPESVPDSQAPEGAEPPNREPEPDYKAMYEALLRDTQEAKGRETFRQAYAEQKAAGMSDAAARLVAKDAAGGKEFPLTDDAETSADSVKPDYAAALNQLHGAFPDVKEIPAEVTKTVMDGGDAVSAYMSYQRARDQKTIGELRAKIRDMERNAANAVQAVARGVSGNGAGQEPVNPFLQGMMDEDW